MIDLAVCVCWERDLIVREGAMEGDEVRVNRVVEVVAVLAEGDLTGGEAAVGGSEVVAAAAATEGTTAKVRDRGIPVLRFALW
jgi:hypothetical protein